MISTDLRHLSQMGKGVSVVVTILSQDAEPFAARPRMVRKKTKKHCVAK
jgi:hypothetical protein